MSAHTTPATGMPCRKTSPNVHSYAKRERQPPSARGARSECVMHAVHRPRSARSLSSFDRSARRESRREARSRPRPCTACSDPRASPSLSRCRLPLPDVVAGDDTPAAAARVVADCLVGDAWRACIGVPDENETRRAAFVDGVAKCGAPAGAVCRAPLPAFSPAPFASYGVAWPPWPPWPPSSCPVAAWSALCDACSFLWLSESAAFRSATVPPLARSADATAECARASAAACASVAVASCSLTL